MTPEQFALFAQIEESHWWFVARRQICRRLVELAAPPRRGKTVIDVGCGTGGNLASMSGDYQCVGIDTTPDAIHFAASRFPRVHFINGEFPKGLEQYLPQAEVLTCLDVMEHVKEDRSFLANLVAAMRPHSHLLLTVPADMTLWSQHDVTNDHFRRYDLASFQETWSGLPVKARLVAYFNSRLYPVIKAIRFIHRLRGGAYGQDGTDFKTPSPPINRMLARVFAGEGDRLLRLVDGWRDRGYRRGVSLVGLLQRQD